MYAIFDKMKKIERALDVTFAVDVLFIIGGHWCYACQCFGACCSDDDQENYFMYRFFDTASYFSRQRREDYTEIT